MPASPSSVNNDIANPTSPNYLTVEGALRRIQELGFPIQMHHLRGWIAMDRLPFFKMGKRLYIDENELVIHFRKLQTQALRKVK